MSKFVNIAGQHSATTGKGDLTLSYPTPGYLSFTDSGIQNGDVFGYVIWDNFGALGPESREVGRGTYNDGVLSRDTVISSTEPGDGYIDCTGTEHVYITALAEDLQTAYISDSPPDYPYNGQLWWDNTNGELYIYYKDVDSSQWVSCNNMTGANTYPSQIGDLSNSVADLYHKLYNKTIYEQTNTSLTIQHGEFVDFVLSQNMVLADELENGQFIKVRVRNNNAYTITWPAMKWLNDVSPTNEPDYFINMWKMNNTLFGLFLGTVPA